MYLLPRYGGEVYAAVLPGIDLEHPRLAAERIHSAVEPEEMWSRRRFRGIISNCQRR